MLWETSIKLRDNESIITVTIILFLSPLPIKNMRLGNLLMVETQFPIVVMNNPRRGFDPVPIRFEIRVNKYLAFVWIGVQLLVGRTSLEEISCSDLIFDKQRLDDCIIQQGCGFYHMNHQRSNLELVNIIRIDNGQYLTMMLNLSSVNF